MEYSRQCQAGKIDLVRSGSQSPHMIWFILASHIIKLVFIFMTLTAFFFQYSEYDEWQVGRMTSKQFRYRYL